MAGEGLAVVVVVNKWDMVDQEKWTEELYHQEVKSQLRQVNWASVVCTTAVKGRRHEAGAVTVRCCAAAAWLGAPAPVHLMEGPG
jgi:predicted GTPase